MPDLGGLNDMDCLSRSTRLVEMEGAWRTERTAPGARRPGASRSPNPCAVLGTGSRAWMG